VRSKITAEANGPVEDTALSLNDSAAAAPFALPRQVLMIRGAVRRQARVSPMAAIVRWEKSANLHGWACCVTCLALPTPASLYQTSAAGTADASAKVVGLTAPVGADPNLVEGTSATAAKQHGLETRVVLMADDGAHPLHCERILRECVIAIEASGNLHAP